MCATVRNIQVLVRDNTKKRNLSKIICQIHNTQTEVYFKSTNVAIKPRTFFLPLFFTAGSFLDRLLENSRPQKHGRHYDVTVSYSTQHTSVKMSHILAGLGSRMRVFGNDDAQNACMLTTTTLP
jgi:hypothetical protein